MDDAATVAMADALVGVDGIVAVMLGGSRARGIHRPDSDWDLGLYYRARPDVVALRRMAAEVTDAEVPGADITVTEPGGWGPWVDGGAWLRVDGRQVDWIYRDLDRVERYWDEAQRGITALGVQLGHPLGFWSHQYVGEVALGKVLVDTDGAVTAIHAAAGVYPEAFRDRLLARAPQAGFALQVARKSAPREDVLHVTACLVEAMAIVLQCVFAHARRWVVNEKGSVADAAAILGRPEWAAEVAALLGHTGTDAATLTATLDRADELVASTLRSL